MPDSSYDPNQPRDGHGRWSRTASESGYVVKDFDARMAEIIAGGRQVGESSECVALVKHLALEVGAAKFWQEGPPIRDLGNHAAIFIEYGSKGLTPGIWALDQSNGEPPKKTFKGFGGRAERSSVIKRK